MAIRNYHDIIIFTDDVEVDEYHSVQSFSVRIFDSPVGQGEKKEIVKMPQAYDLFERCRMLERRELEQDLDKQIQLGEHLAGLLLPPYARSLFQRSLDWAREDEGIRLRLRLDDQLVALPWEYMYVQRARGDRTASGFLALDPRISIVRHEALAHPAGEFGPAGQRRVVIAMATPQPHTDYRKLEHLPAEQVQIRSALAGVGGIKAEYLPFYQGDEQDQIPGARLKDVMQALVEPTDVFHFAGHGVFVKGVGPGGESIIGDGSVILSDANNQAVPVPGDRLAELLRGRGVRLVVLGACETGRRDAFQVWSSVAASLLGGEIPAVLAMQFTIYDDLAAAFMGAFYQALVAGRTIDEAVAVGRTSIRVEALNGRRDTRDWGVPVLYLRAPGGRIFNPISDKPTWEKADEQVSKLIEQQVATVAESGRVIGAVIDGIETDAVQISQQSDRVSGVMVGASLVDFDGGQVHIRQDVETVDGKLVGAYFGGPKPESQQDPWEEVEKLFQSSYQAQETPNLNHRPVAKRRAPNVTSGSRQNGVPVPSAAQS